MRMLDNNALTVPEVSSWQSGSDIEKKFMQDKCYSSCAWAKLAGLPAREISRCERALGKALGWRLQIGKVPAHHMFPHSQSMGDLCGSRASHASAPADTFSTVTGVVRRNNSPPDNLPFFTSTVPTPPFSLTSNIPQGSRMPMPMSLLLCQNFEISSCFAIQ